MQSSQHVGDVRAEDPLIGMQLIQDDEPQLLPERLPGPVVREKRQVQEVGVADENLGRIGLELRPAVGRRVAIQDLGPDARPLREELPEGLQLVLLERLGGKQEQGAGLGVAEQVLQDGKLIRQALPGRRPGDDQDVPAGPGVRHGVDLVGVEPLDADLLQGLPERRGERGRQIGKAWRPGRNLLDVDQVAAALAAACQALEETLQGRRRAPGWGHPGGRARHARSSLTRAPEETARKTVASPDTVPMMFTGLAARGRSSVLAGVRPKKMQKAVPGGQ